MARSPRYDLDLVRQAASGRWPEILSSLGGIVPSLLDGQHHPCPKCGGTDRFRFTNLGDRGACLCNQCFATKNGDGLAALQWLRGWNFQQALQEVGDYLGVSPEKNGHAKQQVDPARDLSFIPWNDLLVRLWCEQKRPITPAAIQSIGGRLARYRCEYTVIALPIWRQGFTDPAGWCLYNISGRKLPTYDRQGGVVGQVKVKTTAGSRPGIIGLPGDAATLWKTEGPSDLLALLSLPLSPGHSAICNAMGAKEDPLRITWLPQLVVGRTVHVIHDCDTPGQEGAARWSAAIAGHAAECRAVVLPYPIAETHGKDLRDWLTEGRSYQELLELAERSTVVEKKDGTPRTLEADDDPHRLARVNLERYATNNEGRTLRYWRDEWYAWKGTRYEKMGERSLRAKLSMSIKEEFDRINIEKLEEYEEKKKAGQIDEDTDKGPPRAQKVSQQIVGNVLQATAGMTILSSSVEMMTWLPTGERKNYAAMQNGILDMDAVIEDRDDYLLPHSPNWFSAISLPYAFDPNATCPKWEAFLERNLELDPERIKLLQEWAGYCLLPDTGYQCFLVLEGEGANGKSVYCAAIEAMLGSANVSHVPLEVFGEKFELTATLDRLVNICGDAGELDKVAEGHIKAFTSGNPMSFGRKYLDPVERVPTARLMLAVNNRPRFSDKSDGVWRRMKLVPWRIQIPHEDRIPNMDKPWWWVQSGELPGILLWAIKGLHRLRQQGCFTHSELCEEALQDYRAEMNPARSFLVEHITESETSRIRSSFLYEIYKNWIKANGNLPLAEKQFGKEVFRIFKKCKKRRTGAGAERFYFYDGIAFSEKEIFGVSTSDSQILF